MNHSAIFDLDGTLIDSMKMWRHFASDFMRDYGLTPHEDIDRTMSTLGFHEASVYISRTYPCGLSPQQLVELWHKRLTDQYAHILKFKPGALEFLNLLHSHGVRLALATATDRPLIMPLLDRFGVTSLFDSILTVGEVGVRKTKPDIYLRALSVLDSSLSRCVVYEDVLHGIRTAKQAGFTVYAVADEMAQREKEKILALADRYIIPPNYCHPALSPSEESSMV